nr:hypothetical protein CFP56_24654 [Quercus suber]
MYVDNRQSKSVDIVDTNTFDVIDTIKVGQDGQALICVFGVVLEGSEGTDNLGKQGLGLRVEDRMIHVNSSHPDASILPTPYSDEPQALITIRQTSG